MKFDAKSDARDYVWDRLEEEGAARFPFPPHGRIPNFVGAAEAADRLLETDELAAASVIKVNPDAPQRYVRARALERGITVLVPTPRLRSGFKRLDPGRIPEDDREKAASLSHMDEWAESVDLEELPEVDAIVTGSVAVTEDGRRCGKGEGYSDLEFAILRELGHPPAPVLTSVHPIQRVEGFPVDAHDLPLAAIATPTETIRVTNPPAPPAGIDWSRLTEEDIEEMPVLGRLRGR